MSCSENNFKQFKHAFACQRMGGGGRGKRELQLGVPHKLWYLEWLTSAFLKSPSESVCKVMQYC